MSLLSIEVVNLIAFRHFREGVNMEKMPRFSYKKNCTRVIPLKHILLAPSPYIYSPVKNDKNLNYNNKTKSVYSVDQNGPALTNPISGLTCFDHCAC